MKIKFRDSEIAQPPVSEIQKETKNKVVRHTPVLKIFFIFAMMAISIFGIYRIYRSGHVYTFGMVSGETNIIKTPSEGIVSAIYGRKGTYIESGEPLITIQPFDNGSIPEAEENLKMKEKMLQQMESLLEKTTTFQHLKNETQGSTDIQNIVEEKQLTFERKKAEANRLKKIYELNKNKYDRTEVLLRLNAATRDHLQAMEAEMIYSKLAMDYAINELSLLKSYQEDTGNYRALTDAMKTGNSFEMEVNRTRSEVSIARLKLETLKKKYSPVTHKAMFNGVITKILVNPGQIISQNETVLVFSSIENQWVDAYIRSDKAINIIPGRNARIYVKGTDRMIRSTVTEKGGLSEKIPDELAEFFPGSLYGLYFRLNIPENSGLTPGIQVRIIL